MIYSNFFLFSSSFLENDRDYLLIFGGSEGIGGNFTPDEVEVFYRWLLIYPNEPAFKFLYI